MKWKSEQNIETITSIIENKSDSSNMQIRRINTDSQMSKENLNRKLNLTSIPTPNWLISTVFVVIAFTLIPIFPILVAFLIGHWISTNNKKK